jgi:hypothetical protein
VTVRFGSIVLKNSDSLPLGCEGAITRLCRTAITGRTCTSWRVYTFGKRLKKLLLDFFNTIGRVLPVVTLCDFSVVATCYAQPNGRVRPEEAFRNQPNSFHPWFRHA